MKKDSQSSAPSVGGSRAVVRTTSCSGRFNRSTLPRTLLALLLASAHLASPAAAVCGKASVYVASTPTDGSSSGQLEYTLGTEWGEFPHEPLTMSLCTQEAIAQDTATQSSAVQTVKAGSYGACSDVRGAADVSTNVQSMSRAGWPELSVSPLSKSCWCAEGTAQPYVRLRVRQVTDSASAGSSTVATEAAGTGSNSKQAERSSSRMQQGRKALAGMMPLWPEDSEQQQQQLAGQDGCKGGALPGTAGSGHVVLLDSWYRLMRDEVICQESGLGHSFAIMFELVDTC